MAPVAAEGDITLFERVRDIGRLKTCRSQSGATSEEVKSLRAGCGALRDKRV
jgi:hypothetical protein